MSFRRRARIICFSSKNPATLPKRPAVEVCKPTENASIEGIYKAECKLNAGLTISTFRRAVMKHFNVLRDPVDAHEDLAGFRGVKRAAK